MTLDTILCICLVLMIFILRRDQNKLKRRIECNKEMITELWRIENDRTLLEAETADNDK